MHCILAIHSFAINQNPKQIYCLPIRGFRNDWNGGHKLVQNDTIPAFFVIYTHLARRKCKQFRGRVKARYSRLQLTSGVVKSLSSVSTVARSSQLDIVLNVAKAQCIHHRWKRRGSRGVAWLGTKYVVLWYDGDALCFSVCAVVCNESSSIRRSIKQLLSPPK